MEVIFNTQPMPYWDWRVALDLFFGGMGVGTLLLAVGIDWRFGDKHRRFAQTAALLSPAFVLLGLLFLMSKLGRPTASVHLYLGFHPTSALWWGGWLQLLLVAGSVVYALWWRDEAKDGARRALGWLLSPLALAVGVYHGWLLSAFEVRALWSTGATILAAVLAALTTGMAAALLLYLLRARSHGRMLGGELDAFLDEMHGLRNLLGAGLLAQLAVFAFWWISLKGGGMAEQQALAAANQAYGPLFWVVGIGLGLVLPLAIGLGTLVKRNLSGQAHWAGLWTSSALILVGGLVIRWAVVMGGQAAPLTMQLG